MVQAEPLAPQDKQRSLKSQQQWTSIQMIPLKMLPHPLWQLLISLGKKREILSKELLASLNNVLKTNRVDQD